MQIEIMTIVSSNHHTTPNHHTSTNNITLANGDNAYLVATIQEKYWDDVSRC